MGVSSKKKKKKKKKNFENSIFKCYQFAKLLMFLEKYHKTL